MSRQKTYSFFDTHFELSPEEKEFSYLEPEEARDRFVRKLHPSMQNESFCEYDDNVSSDQEAIGMLNNTSKIPKSIIFQKADDPNKNTKSVKKEQTAGQVPSINKVKDLSDMK